MEGLTFESGATTRTMVGRVFDHAVAFPGMFHRAFRRALKHDALNLAQSAAYSAIIALFPALVVAAALIALLPDVAPLKVEIGEFFDEVLPSNAFSLLTSYFISTPGTPHPHTVRSLLLAGLVSLSGGSSVVATLMEGARRAKGLPQDCWRRGERRIRAVALVPLSLLPLLLATVLVVFGRFLSEWAAAYLPSRVQGVFFALALAVRWSVLTGRSGRVDRIDLPFWLTGTEAEKGIGAGCGCGYGDVVCVDAGLRLVRHAVCELQPDLWIAGGRNCAASVVEPGLSQRALRGRVQRAGRGKAARQTRSEEQQAPQAWDGVRRVE